MKWTDASVREWKMNLETFLAAKFPGVPCGCGKSQSGKLESVGTIHSEPIQTLEDDYFIDKPAHTVRCVMRFTQRVRCSVCAKEHVLWIGDSDPFYYQCPNGMYLEKNT